MRTYTTDAPKFSESISIVETSDVAHADNVNASVSALQDSVLYLKKRIDGMASAGDFDSSKDYHAGDVCVHDGDLYKCTADTAEDEDWNPDHWEKIEAVDIYNIKADVEALSKKIDDGNALAEATLAPTGWTGEKPPWKQTVNVAGLTAKSAPEVYILRPDDGINADDYIEQSGRIFGGETADEKLTMYAYVEKPTLSIKIAVKGR